MGRISAHGATLTLVATRELLAEGITPTVEQAAERAAISRTTAYRYFPNQRALLIASYPELAETSLIDHAAPTDPVARLDLVTDNIARQILEHEAELRTMLACRSSRRGRATEPAAAPRTRHRLDRERLVALARTYF